RQRCLATSSEKYEIILSAPARLIDAIEQTFHSSSSIHPCMAAAFIIAYSPLTFWTAIGKPNLSFAILTRSRYARAGFIMTMSAPSLMSVSISIITCLLFAKDTWYDDLSICSLALANAADRNGV